MNYKDQLLDPRWQRKRLEILTRDDFTCQQCYDSTSTLMVHHLFYEKGLMAWEAKNENLLTLCNSCHEYFHSEMPKCHKIVVDNMKLKLRNAFIAGCAAELFSDIKNLNDLIYLLYELKVDEERLIRVLRAMFQRDVRVFMKENNLING